MARPRPRFFGTKQPHQVNEFNHSATAAGLDQFANRGQIVIKFRRGGFNIVRRPALPPTTDRL